MVWFILVGLMFLVGFVIVFKDDSYEFIAVSFTGLIGCFILAFCINFSYITKEATRVNLTSKQELTMQLKNNYFKNENGVLIDVANNEIATSIIDSKKNVIISISDFNSSLIQWGIEYRYRFWTFTFVKPNTNIRPINLTI